MDDEKRELLRERDELEKKQKTQGNSFKRKKMLQEINHEIAKIESKLGMIRLNELYRSGKSS